jgi:uncharacterized protein YwgA
MTIEDIVVGIVSLNGGELVGKTRLQKTVYLLENCGLEGEFDFTYHNYGPFSREVEEATEFAVISNRIEQNKKLGNHGIRYFEFISKEEAPNKLGNLDGEMIQESLKSMGGYSSIELELAATIAFLNNSGLDRDLVDGKVEELKPAKATDEKLQRAHNLLSDLQIA